MRVIGFVDEKGFTTFTKIKNIYKKKTKLEKKKQQADLAFTDFQLYQALNLLEAMSINSNTAEKRS